MNSNGLLLMLQKQKQRLWRWAGTAQSLLPCCNGGDVLM
jgi:hypothetical protein